jgi:holo-[acyl-carrier protein] synthase
MIVGTGIDIVEVARIKQIFDRFGYKFTERLFTSSEIDYCFNQANPFIHLAGRFAAKEAVAKSLGARPSFHFKRIEILNRETGEPYVRMSGEAERVYENLECNALISISHTENYATANCVLDGWDDTFKC